ncbi:hypothetical protein FGO68_gene11716 [Halteria grandinella]|uniref:Transmembrane protein n=1 Tax=Halteria grandinella TaxID=5974 RepID=A0A8J8SUX3_HALGN|nr:hypothetical protein FGO68_gene11716 [Halteria grandinella]
MGVIHQQDFIIYDVGKKFLLSKFLLYSMWVLQFQHFSPLYVTYCLLNISILITCTIQVLNPNFYQTCNLLYLLVYFQSLSNVLCIIEIIQKPESTLTNKQTKVYRKQIVSFCKLRIPNNFNSDKYFDSDRVQLFQQKQP